MKLSSVIAGVLVTCVGCGPTGDRQSMGAGGPDSADTESADGVGDASDSGPGEDDLDADSDSGTAGVPEGPFGGFPEYCEDLPECEGVACAESDAAAERLSQLQALVDERGFGDVFTVYKAEIRDSSPDRITINYALARTDGVARTWDEFDISSDEAAQASFAAVIDTWSPLWLDPDVDILSPQQMRDTLDSCYDGLGEEFGCWSMTTDFNLQVSAFFWDDTQCFSTAVDATYDAVTAKREQCDIEPMGDQCGDDAD